MTTPTSASQAGSTRVYGNEDGSTTVRTGGTVAWRNNNPGNIKYGRNAKRAWAERGGLAVCVRGKAFASSSGLR